MTKIPHFFLAGAIPTAQVGAVLEAMYLAGAKQLDVRPLPPKAKAEPEALPRPNGNANADSVRARVLVFAYTHEGKFTLAELKAAIPANENALYSAIHTLKHKKLLRASGPQMKRHYILTARGKKES